MKIDINDIDGIKKQAKMEIQYEKFRKLVDEEKNKMKAKKSFIDIIFPFDIKITKKK